MLSRPTLNHIEDAFASGVVSRDPHPTYRELRERAPVYWSEHLEQWLVTPFDLVEDVLMRPEGFSNFEHANFIARLGRNADLVPTLVLHFQGRGLVSSDPPDHTRLRRAVRGPFSVRAVDGLRESIQERVDSMLDGFQGRLEVGNDFARPLTVSVISDLLGVPEEDRGQFPTWSDDFITFFGTVTPTLENAQRFDADLVEWRALLERLFAERLAHPRDDLISHMSQVVEAGEMSREEALFTGVHLMNAGFETTASAIATTIFCLLANPDQMAAIRDSPGLVRGAIEEAIRLETPVQRGRRSAIATCEVRGRQILAGEPVVPIFASANRDAHRFDHADSYDLYRDFTGLQHDAFGRGIHFCLGAPLARLEAEIAITSLLERFPDLHTPDGFVPRWKPSLALRALEALPLETGQAASTD